VEEDETEINTCGDNILNYNNNIVRIKNNNKSITFKELIYEKVINLKIKVQFINYDNDEYNHDVIDDILHYAYNNKCFVNIKSSKNISNDYFNITKYNNNYLFKPKKDISHDKINKTVIIIGFNQLTYIKKMVEQLEKYTTDIVILDNASTFKPLLDYYDNGYKYTLLKQKSNFGHKVYEKQFIIDVIGNTYFLTDPDLEFNKELPATFMDELIEISNYYLAEKVGMALEYKSKNIRSNVTAFGKSIVEWEQQYWRLKFYYKNYEIYDGALDTTFCLVNKNNKGSHYRIAGNFLCKHKPWYNGYEKEISKDEFEFYKNTSKCSNYF
jgi:hypothetical protein